MPPRARPVGAGQEPGAEGMHRLSPLLVRVHDAVSLDQGRTAKSGVGQDLRCRVFDRFKILGSSAKYDDTLGYPTSLAERNEGSPTISHGRIDGYQVVNTPPPQTPHPREELVRNLALWEARGPADYSFEFQRSCSCPPEYHMPVRITARDGVADSVAFTRPALVWGEH